MKRKLTRQERFEKFDRENPQVYDLFERFAKLAIAKGRTKIGARLIWERIRWYTMVETARDREQDFKLNDHYVPHYARKFALLNPKHASLFELRVLKIEERPAPEQQKLFGGVV